MRKLSKFFYREDVFLCSLVSLFIFLFQRGNSLLPRKQEGVYNHQVKLWKIGESLKHTHTKTEFIFHLFSLLTGAEWTMDLCADQSRILVWSKVLWPDAHPCVNSLSRLLRHAGIRQMNSDPNCRSLKDAEKPAFDQLMMLLQTLAARSVFR